MTAAAVDQVLGADPAPGVVVNGNRRDSVVGHRLLDRHTGDAAPSHLTKLGIDIPLGNHKNAADALGLEQAQIALLPVIVTAGAITYATARGIDEDAIDAGTWPPDADLDAGSGRRASIALARLEQIHQPDSR